MVNTFARDVAGTVDLDDGEIALDGSVSGALYLTGDIESPCPRCESGRCTSGERVGLPCTPAGRSGTSADCLPDALTLLGHLLLDASVSTTESVRGAADGFFCRRKTCTNSQNPCETDAQCPKDQLCEAQVNPGAFGNPLVRAIVQSGTPAGDLRDGPPHSLVLSAASCRDHSSALLTGAFDLPGPATLSIGGTVQLRR